MSVRIEVGGLIPCDLRLEPEVGTSVGMLTLTPSIRGGISVLKFMPQKPKPCKPPNCIRMRV